eukprot:CAMPEP_0205920660 /NCGR_PEP_ID=MMETSP1325-20131115/11543_1 /ASSEMBLY_ACC=CAM_ASM_000708 /TAXON_ID=236786 /ORGANISM="Florenciella sp., Strain RCC1007" /LENGTH=87 /DNA_ID=CAMNT_0053288367 /DNA_START=274 /DNA_END=533 /DNA_ORIENTATION=-
MPALRAYNRPWCSGSPCSFLDGSYTTVSLARRPWLVTLKMCLAHRTRALATRSAFASFSAERNLDDYAGTQPFDRRNVGQNEEQGPG